MKERRIWTLWLPLFLIILPGALAFLFIHRFAVNVPFWDQWEFIPTLRLFRQGDPNWLEATWRPHVSHRLFLPKLIFLGLAQLSNWNILVEIYLSHALSWTYLFGLWLVYKQVSVPSLWGFIPVAWLTFSFSQWENMLWGWQVAIYLLMVGLIFTIYLLSFKQLVWVVFASIFALIASLSFVNGLLVWPIGLLLLIALKADRKTVAFWGITGAALIGFYFQDYVLPANHSSPADAFSDPLPTLQYFFANVGAPLGGANVTSARLSIATGTGLFLFGTIFFILWHKFSAAHPNRLRISESDAILGALLLFSLTSSAVITAGRVGLGRIEWSLGSRYITITSIAVISIYLFLLNIVSGKQRQPVPSAWIVAFLLLLAGGQIMHSLGGYRMGKIQYEYRLKAKYALRTISQQPDEALERLYVPEVIRQRTPYLQEQNLSVFAEQRDDPSLATDEQGGKCQYICYDDEVISLMLNPGFAHP